MAERRKEKCKYCDVKSLDNKCVEVSNPIIMNLNFNELDEKENIPCLEVANYIYSYKENKIKIPAIHTEFRLYSSDLVSETIIKIKYCPWCGRKL